MNTTIEKDETTCCPVQDKQANVRPYFEVEPGKDAYSVRVYLPGVSKEHVSIRLEDEHLIVEGKREHPKQENWKAVHREIPTADYRIKLRVNVEVDGEQISAKSEAGILTITLPVAEAVKPKEIKISE